MQPSTMREGFTTVPSVTWDDVGALEDVKVELINNISKPILRPDVFKAMGWCVQEHAAACACVRHSCVSPAGQMCVGV